MGPRKVDANLCHTPAVLDLPRELHPFPQRLPVVTFGQYMSAATSEVALGAVNDGSLGKGVRVRDWPCTGMQVRRMTHKSGMGK
jgi:hypothetical protein